MGYCLHCRKLSKRHAELENGFRGLVRRSLINKKLKDRWLEIIAEGQHEIAEAKEMLARHQAACPIAQERAT